MRRAKYRVRAVKRSDISLGSSVQPAARREGRNTSTEQHPGRGFRDGRGAYEIAELNVREVPVRIVLAHRRVVPRAVKRELKRGARCGCVRERGGDECRQQVARTHGRKN